MPDVPLTLSGREVFTVFDLLGDLENDLTFACGWSMAQAPDFAHEVARAAGAAHCGNLTAVRLQEAHATGGFTDIEMLFEDAHLILEAKRGWVVPTASQLGRYRERLSSAASSRLITISELEDHTARSFGLPNNIDGVTVRQLSWTQVRRCAQTAARACRGLHEKRLLKELDDYLRGVTSVTDKMSSLTYCVSLGRGGPAGMISFVDVVVQDSTYFHPIAKGWPASPPPFMAFRWAGKVQRACRVEDARVVASLAEHYPEVEINALSDRPHAVYSLGPNILQGRTLPNGRTYANGRVWVALDLLFTSVDLAEAVHATRARRGR